jgi:hypothetical protein
VTLLSRTDNVQSLRACRALTGIEELPDDVADAIPTQPPGSNAPRAPARGFLMTAAAWRAADWPEVSVEICVGGDSASD